MPAVVYDGLKFTNILVTDPLNTDFVTFGASYIRRLTAATEDWISVNHSKITGLHNAGFITAGSGYLAANSVTTAALAANSVTTAKLANHAVSFVQLDFGVRTTIQYVTSNVIAYSNGLYGAAWSGVTNYNVGDTVVQAGIGYHCTVAHINHVPPNAGFWAVEASPVLVDSIPQRFQGRQYATVSLNGTSFVGDKVQVKFHGVFFNNNGSPKTLIVSLFADDISLVSPSLDAVAATIVTIGANSFQSVDLAFEWVPVGFPVSYDYSIRAGLVSGPVGDLYINGTDVSRMLGGVSFSILEGTEYLFQ